jgi:hypothetical protein
MIIGFSKIQILLSNAKWETFYPYNYIFHQLLSVNLIAGFEFVQQSYGVCRVGEERENHLQPVNSDLPLKSCCEH